MTEKPQINNDADSSDADEIKFLELLLVIVRRRMVIVKICSVVILLSICFSLLMKNVYTATSTILPPPREYGVASTGGSGGGGGGGGMMGGALLMNAYLELHVSIFKSHNVLDAVIKRLDLQTDYKAKNIDETRRVFSKKVNFKTGKDGTITVSAVNKNPEMAAKIANTLVDEMSKRSSQFYLSKAGTERNFLKQRLLDVKQELTSAEDNLRVFQEKHKILKPEGQIAIAVEGIARLKLEIINKEVQLATLRSSMTDESSDVKVLQAAISKLNSQLAAMSSNSGADNVIPVTGKIPGIASEYIRLVRDVKTLEAVFEQLSRQHEIAKVHEARDITMVQVIEEAIPPVRKTGPKRSVIVIISAFSAFFISIIVIFVQEALAKLAPEDLEIIDEIKQSLCFWRRQK